MKRQQAFRFELIVHPGQTRMLRRFTGACRDVYNRGLAHQKANYQSGGKFINYEGMCKVLTAWRSDPSLPWLKAAPSQSLQQTLKDLDRAYKRFFAGAARFPKFKRKEMTVGICYPTPGQFKLDEANAKVFLPKLGWVRYRKSRPVLGDLRQMTVTSAGGRWFISIQTEQECAEPAHPEQQREIAIDLGARKDFALAIGQDGAMVKTLNAYRKAEGRLRHLQRCLSRKKKGSKNRAKARHRLARCHFKVANQRKDFLHKASHILTRDYGVIVIEDLKVKEMTASKVNPKQRNKAILDQGWFMFRQMLQYKAQWRGGLVIAIDPAHTSTTCSACGHCNPLNRPSPDRFRCVACGHTMQADQNAAINIQRAGHARLVCGEDISQRESGVASMKQEHSRADRGSQ
jgi:putative transposase